MLVPQYHTPVLMYHSISSQASAKFRPFTVSPIAFAAQMAYLASTGYTTLTVSQFAKTLTDTNVRLPERPVVLTFDDGFADFFSMAFPLLLYYGFAATLYVSTAFLNGTSRWLQAERETLRPVLSWKQLLQISSSPIECGAHTHSHLQLDTLSVAQARWEIGHSKHLLEQRLERSIQTFAYPFGYHSVHTRQLVREAGFTSACAVRRAIRSDANDPFTLQRCMVGTDTTLDEFAALLSRPVTLRETIGETLYGYTLTPTWRCIRRCSSLRTGARKNGKQYGYA